jgi:hypothetical protein
VAVLTLALGIGANTAIFSLIDALLLKSLPGVEDPQQLVLVTVRPWPFLSYPQYEHLRDGNQSLSGLFAHSGLDMKYRMGVAGSDAIDAEWVWAPPVSGNFFSVLGVPAILGRTLTPEDGHPGNPQPVAVISHDCWRRHFGQDPAVIGKTIMLEGVSNVLSLGDDEIPWGMRKGAVPGTGSTADKGMNIHATAVGLAYFQTSTAFRKFHDYRG